MRSTDKMKRIYHPIHKWEEMDFNMWGTSTDKARDLRRAIIFTGNHRLYGAYMRRVTKEWPISCENSLTDIRSNRRAWLGHAAVALALRIPENIVRAAWGYLNEQQQRKANDAADYAISLWENQRADTGLPQEVGGQMLLDWNSRHGARSSHGHR